MSLFAIILTVLVVLLLCVITFVLKQNKKLSITRSKLAEANDNLPKYLWRNIFLRCF